MPPLSAAAAEPLIDSIVSDPERAYRFLVEETRRSPSDCD
jgi:ubiquinone/menaquinone biosynthesis C-methylase UbiE